MKSCLRKNIYKIILVVSPVVLLLSVFFLYRTSYFRFSRLTPVFMPYDALSENMPSCFIFDDTLTNGEKKVIMHDYSLLPYTLKEKICCDETLTVNIKKDYTVSEGDSDVLVSDIHEAWYERDSNSIYVIIKDNFLIKYYTGVYSGIQFLHEIGHYSDYSFGILSASGDFRELVTPDVWDYMARTYDFVKYGDDGDSLYKEAYAVIFTEYIKDPRHLKKSFPILYDYFDSLYVQ